MKELKDLFYHCDVFKISDIQEEMCTRKQGDCSISSYYTKLKMLWQELDDFCPILACDCYISCLAIDKIHIYKDFNIVIRFLKGLDLKSYLWILFLTLEKFLLCLFNKKDKLWTIHSQSSSSFSLQHIFIYFEFMYPSFKFEA